MNATDTIAVTAASIGVTPAGGPIGPSRHRRVRGIAALALFAMMLPATLSAQYFGRNKVRYETFDFKVLHTDHFNIHYYPEEEQAVRDAARMAERWYERLSTFFGHDIIGRTPIVLYANQGDFQQTTTIGDEIGEGTGGFTEPIKDRIVLPLTGSYAANDHVIGHELVHRFQYDIVQRGGGGQEGLQKMYQLPLWFIEGMAEYLSIGRVDPNTAMWLRDVVAQDKVPTISDITRNPRYFPYRYGQAIWAYIAGRWGDDMVPRLYQAGLDLGWEMAFKRLLGLDEDSLSSEWIAAVKAQYGAGVAARTAPKDLGRRVLAKEIDAGDMNVAPSISPDGRYVAFLSSRDIFSIDLFLADAETGEVLDELVSVNSNPHLDALRFINSAGAWSPDARKFVTVIYSEGNDRLALIDVPSRDIEQTIEVPGIGEISNPSWSPDGARIVFSGSSGGISDLYIIEVATRKVTRLTNDRYADFQPVWSPDGKTIAFASDRGSETDFGNLTYSPLRLTTIDVATRAIQVLPRFSDGKNINPQYSPDGRDLYFISDRGGFSDVYRYTLATNEVRQVTNVSTGVSGITEQSPALTVARGTGRLMFSVFEQGSYVIHALEPAAAVGTLAADTVSEEGGILPPPHPGTTQIVSVYLREPEAGLLIDTTFEVTDYDAALKLDYIGTPTLGVAFGGYGTGFVGGISAFFSDMLGYHNLYAAVQASGSIDDLGGIVQYMYTKNRWGWGVSAGHIPYTTSAVSTGTTTVEIGGQPVLAQRVDQYFQRVFQDQIQLLGEYPFSTTKRFEVSAGFQRISYGLEVLSQVVVDNTVVSQRETELPSPDGVNLLQGTTAFVGDNSFFGFTSPIMGERFRLEVGGTAGSLRFGTFLADYRRYFFANPFTFALRGIHYGRYGADAEDERLSPLFLGYESNVRGYSFGSFDASECSGGNGEDCPEFDRLLGSRIIVANAEIRVPLFGTSQFGLIDFPFIPTEISAFVDGGLAWSPGDHASIRFDRRTADRVPVFSAGGSARFNVFGYLVLELFYAYPFQRSEAGWQFGFQIAPGW